VTCSDKTSSLTQVVLPVRDYNLAMTLESGQVFRWKSDGKAWEGIVGRRWVRLQTDPAGLLAEALAPVPDWNWLTEYFQTDADLPSILSAFPADEPMQRSLRACQGLRLLRQDPWECLASFILSSSKQIIQIQQIVALLCQRYGDPLPVPANSPPAHVFPPAERLAALTEKELRACKMGFRAPGLLATSRLIASGGVSLEALRTQSFDEARGNLMALPGVGPKIASCVLLFAYGHPQAFPVDVWVEKALRQLYFPGRRPTPRRLARFAATHFGAQAGYAQQYLFHFMRMNGKLRSKSNTDGIHGGTNT
jgi:N-glycosylase/DNA lyase